MLSSNHSVCDSNSFYPSIVRGFNLGSDTITLVYTVPPYLIGALITFAMAYNSDRNNECGWHIIASTTIAVFGLIISVATLGVPARYLASFIYIIGCLTGKALIFAWGCEHYSSDAGEMCVRYAIINVLW